MEIYDGVLYEVEQSDLIYIDRFERQIKIIGPGAFSFCKFPINSEFKIPKNVTKIKSHAFQFCDTLSTIVIPKTVVEIENKVFWECTQLKHGYMDKEGNIILSKKEIPLKNDLEKLNYEELNKIKISGWTRKPKYFGEKSL